MRTSTNFMYDAAIYEPPLGAGDPGCREFWKYGQSPTDKA